MKLIYRIILIALLVIAPLIGAFQFGYYVAERTRSEAESPLVYTLKHRIRELEEREKSRTSSDTNTEKPPESE